MPIVDSHGQILHCGFKHGSEPNETFSRWSGDDKTTPRCACQDLKKDLIFLSVLQSYGPRHLERAEGLDHVEKAESSCLVSSMLIRL